MLMTLISIFIDGCWTALSWTSATATIPWCERRPRRRSIAAFIALRAMRDRHLRTSFRIDE